MKNKFDPKRKHILIVEDDDTLRKLYTFILEQEYEVKACADCMSFNLNINSKLPDLIIMNLGLPDGNGLELCQMIKSNPRTTDIPVLIISGKDDLAKHRNNCKADALMRKPFELEEFLTQISQIASHA